MNVTAAAPYAVSTPSVCQRAAGFCGREPARGGYLPVGADAPPDGLDPAADFSLAGSFSFSAEAPPEGLLSPAPLALPPLVGSSVASLPPDSFAGLSLEVVPALLDVVEVDVVWTAAFSALVSLGGVMSGVLFGIASAVPPPPPHAARVVPASSSASASSAARAVNDFPSRIQAVPSGDRTSGSR
jgi:hypothetical protein